jgi:hypothetical protein
MARLTDPEKMRCYRNALANWRYAEFVVYGRLAQEWLRLELDDMPQRYFSRLLHNYVQAGGEIDQVHETRTQRNHYSHHYDLRPVVNGRMHYVETVLDYRDPSDPDDPVVTIVNIHLA